MISYDLKKVEVIKLPMQLLVQAIVNLTRSGLKSGFSTFGKQRKCSNKLLKLKLFG